MTKIYLISALVLSSTSGVFASELGKKEASKIDFHSMIVESAQEKSGLAQSVQSKTTTKSQKLQQKKTVTDFVDLEIGWGEPPKLVDRR